MVFVGRIERERDWKVTGYAVLGCSCAEFDLGDSRLIEAISGGYQSLTSVVNHGGYRYTPLDESDIERLRMMVRRNG